MKRFIAAFIVGSLLMFGGQIIISLGLHPDQLKNLGLLLQGALSLGLGCAITAGGMLGLAETYGLHAKRMHQLLANKEIPADEPIAIQDDSALEQTNQSFWHGYRQSTQGLLIFLLGFLLIAVGLSSFAHYYYFAGLGIGLGILGALALTLGYLGLSHMHKAHLAIKTSQRVLAEQPDRSAIDPADQPISWERPKRPKRRPNKVAYTTY